MTKMTADKFFSLLFRQVRKDFRVLFTVKEEGHKAPQKGKRASPFKPLGEMIQKINDAKLAGYFHCGVDLAQERTLRLRNIDVSGVGFLWADLDKNLSPQELKAIQEDELRPTLMVRSGNGYHFYWILNEFQYNKQAATEANRWLSKRFDADSTVDMARLLRIPGTYNWKDPNNPKPVEVVWYDSDPGGFPQEWDFESFGRIKGDGPKSSLAERNAIYPVPLKDFGSDPRLTEEIAKLINTNLAKGYRSERDMQLARLMATAGFDANEIFSVLVHPSWPSGDKGRDSHGYARHQAAEAVAASNLNKGLAEAIKKGFSGKLKVSFKGPTKGPQREAQAQPQAQAGGGLQTAEEEFTAPVQEGTALSVSPTPKIKTASSLKQEILRIHEDVLQVGGSYRTDKHSPKFGGEFGRQVAKAFLDHGYRFVRDEQFRKNYIADRKGRVWEASGEDFKDFILEMTAFASSQSEFGYIVEGINNFIRLYGEKITVGRWFHYDKHTASYYILADDNAGVVFSIDSQGNIGRLFNGQGDVFLRPRLQPAVPLNLTPGVSTKDAVLELEKGFTRFIAGNEHTKRLMTCFTLASVLCYGSPVMTFPLLHLTGPSGKGKSHTLGLMTSLLFGYYQLLTYTTAAAFRVVPTETLVAIDDKETISSSLEEYLLLASTAATRGICNSDDQTDVVLQYTHVINAITSIDALKTVPLLRRALVVEINKELFPSEVSLKKSGIDNITEQRDFIWSGLVPIIGRVAASFGNGEFDSLSEWVYDSILIDDFRGQADFMALMVLIEKELCAAVGRPFSKEVTLQGFMDVAGFSDAEAVISRDPLVQCLESFFEKLFEEKTTEMYDLGEVPGNSVKLVTIHKLNQMQWSLTEDDENDTIYKELGCRVRGIKASATGWVSIFSTDTREFGRSINSPASLGIQFKRLLNKKDFPFYIKKGEGRQRRLWFVYQKLDTTSED